MNDETTLLAHEQETAIKTEAEQPEALDDGPKDLDEIEADDGASDIDDDEPEGDGESEAEEPALVEVEYEGKQYQVPPELQKAIMQERDYTQKSQANAEMRRQLDARVAEVNRMAEVTQEELSIRAHLLSVDERLRQFANADWQQLEADDPLGAQSLWRQYQMLKDTRAEAANALDQKARERAGATEQETVRRLQETANYARTKIQGWTPEIDQKVTSFATQELGFDRAALNGALSPQVYRTLHLAWLGHQTMNAATRPKAANRTDTIKPLKTVSSRTSGVSTKDPADMSMEEYSKWAAKRFKG